MPLRGTSSCQQDSLDLENQDRIAETRIKNQFTVVKSSFGSGKVPKESGRLQAFTDGSKLRDGSVGIGIFLPLPTGDHIEHSSYLGSRPTVFQAEVAAIAQAAERFEESMASRPDLPNSFTIYSDSQAALSALHKELVSSETVARCKASLNRVGEYASIRLRWVKGHADSAGNKRADELARGAAGRRRPRLSTEPPTPKEYIDLALKDHMAERWAERWKSMMLSFARQTRIWFQEPCPAKSAKILSYGRATFSTLVRWISGHAFLRKQNHRAAMAESPTCRSCGQAEERADHVLLNCDGYFRERADCFLTVNIDAREPAWEVEQLVKFLRKPRVAALEEEEEDETDDARDQRAGVSSSEDGW